MRYLALLYWDEDRRPTPASPGYEDFLAAYAEANKSFRESGVFVDANPLENSDKAVSVRLRNGQVLVTDGPFAETKERLGGYYLFECSDMEEAVRSAKQLPAAQHGVIEVRPVLAIDPSDPK